jgi:hypothetical protein
MAASSDQSQGPPQSKLSNRADGSQPSSTVTHNATGPRTSSGKERSKYNAVKHGILSQGVVLKSESRSDYESLLMGLREDLKPEGTFEDLLVEKLATFLWRYRRVIALETADFESPNLGLELSFAAVSPLSRLDHLIRYETSIERAFDRTLSQLERHQNIRMGRPTFPAIKLDISSV